MAASRGKNSAHPNMPLHCSICPKKPKFSDLSHLLTHIGSKGHLANYFNIEVKAASDPVSRQVFDTYTAWFEAWNVRALVHERLKQKERKQRGGGRGSGRTTAVRSTATSTTERGHVPGNNDPAGQRGRAVPQSMLDPQLDRYIKTEPNSRTNTPAVQFGRHPAGLLRPHPYPMSTQSWPNTPYGFSSLPYEAPQSYNPASSNWSDDSDEIRSQHGEHHGPDSTPRSHYIDAALDDDMVNDASKLKGVYWTGMGMFDSATMDMRRKRNQRKAVSVIQSLKATSEEILPTELVFDPAGTLQRERVITGNPNHTDGHLQGESTPEPDTPPKKTKPARKTRPALREKDANSGRVLSSRTTRNHQHFKSKRSYPHFKDHGDDENDLTYAYGHSRRRTGISVHRDNSGPDITFGGQSISKPQIGMDILASGFRNPFTHYVSMNNNSSMYGNSPFGSDNAQLRQPSHGISVPGGFRPANNYGASFPSSSNLGSFGQLNGNTSMFASSAIHHNPFSAPGSHLENSTTYTNQSGFSSFPQSYGGVFPPHRHGHNQPQHEPANNHNPWDFFGTTNRDLGTSNQTDTALPNLTEFSGTNPLFFAGNYDAVPAQEDDDATVSAPATPNRQVEVYQD